jgi:hypothetical protein
MWTKVVLWLIGWEMENVGSQFHSLRHTSLMLQENLRNYHFNPRLNPEKATGALFQVASSPEALASGGPPGQAGVMVAWSEQGSWNRPLNRPIEIEHGNRRLGTLADVGRYILALPETSKRHEL